MRLVFQISEYTLVSGIQKIRVRCTDYLYVQLRSSIMVFAACITTTVHAARGAGEGGNTSQPRNKQNTYSQVSYKIKKDKHGVFVLYDIYNIYTTQHTTAFCYDL